MSLSIGIVGLPNVGKSTLFNALTRKSVPAENYPFCTIDPSVGVVAVPDERLRQLTEFSHSQKEIPPVIEFVDIAGLVRGASHGEGLGNQFLAHIREVDLIAHVVRYFEDPDIHHVEGRIEPLSDIETINTELILADLATLEKRIANIEKDVRAGNKKAKREKELFIRVEGALKEGTLVSEIPLTEEEKNALKELHLLTLKPMLFILNRKSSALNIDEQSDGRAQSCRAYLEQRGYPSLFIDAYIETEVSGLAHDDKATFRREYGVIDDGISSLIKKSYEMLGLITFFTTGEEETRGWTIRENTTAKEAGSAIHTDFRDKFIKAEIISTHDLLKCGSFSQAREKGLLRTEGKEYIVRDGDVVEFKI